MEESCQKKIKKYFNNKVDVIMSDMAVSTTGNKYIDSFSTGELSLSAMKFSKEILKSKGIFISKFFMGSAFNDIIKNAKVFSNLEKTLNNFIRKNKLGGAIFKDISSLKNLSKLNSKMIFSTNFGRDIEYYTGIVFEIFVGQKEIARGGRYDGLLKSLKTKKNIPAVGAATEPLSSA